MIDLPTGIYVFAFGLFGLLALAVFYLRRAFSNDSPFPRRIHIFSIPCLLILLTSLVVLFAEVSRERGKVDVRSEVRDAIRSVTSGEFTATANGQMITNPSPIVQALLSMRGVGPNHSYPSQTKKRFDVVLISQDAKVRILLLQDDHNENAYWVFSPRHTAFRSPKHAVSRIRLDDASYLPVDQPKARLPTRMP